MYQKLGATHNILLGSVTSNTPGEQQQSVQVVPFDHYYRRRSQKKQLGTAA